MNESLKYELKQGICTLTINRPEAMNALNHEVFAGLDQAADLLSADEGEVRCVILRGAGKAFCAGLDLKMLGANAENPNLGAQAAVVETIAALPMPVIAQVHSYCFAGALELALACDLIFVDEQTRLADTHSKWGLSPIWGMTQRMPRKVGAARAKDLMFSSRTVEAAEALSIGLVERVFAEGELEAKTVEYAQAVAENSNHSHRVCKQIIEATDGLRLHDGLDYEYTNSPGACHDMQERVAAFINRKG